jgi:mono/diheme cytochrome c family protein
MMRKTLVVGFLVVWCGPPQPSYGQDQAQDAALMAAGEEVFVQNCAVCHGEDLTPIPGAADLKTLRPDQRARFDSAVMAGVGGEMPAWEGILTDEHLDQLWAFIQAN